MAAPVWDEGVERALDLEDRHRVRGSALGGDGDRAEMKGTLADLIVGLERGSDGPDPAATTPSGGGRTG
jgi:hypothetical protein